jgi:peptidyl-prolyl cis-trans isomerase D
MPLMTKMRDNMPAILIGLVVAFVIMIIFEWGMDFGGIRGEHRSVLGKVNDREISYQEFSDAVRNVTEMQRQQFGGEIDEQFMGFIREQVWDNMVTEILFEEEIRRRGIEVTDDEISDWVFGDNPPPFLVQQFTDEDGQFNRTMYEQTLTDPQNRPLVIQLEQMLRQQLKQQKLQSLLMASVRVTEGEVRQRFKEDNIEMDVRYVVLDPNTLVDADGVTVTDEEIQRYYNANTREFMRPPQRNLEYVVFPFEPSRGDTNEALRELEYVQQLLEEGEEFLDLVDEYSRTSFADSYFRPGEISPAKQSAVFGAEVGDIVGPLFDDDGVHLIKIIDTRTGPEEYLRAQHILLPRPEGTEIGAVVAKADSLIIELRDGADFAELAREHSSDPGSAQNGGDLGWFGRGRMVEPFERAAFGAQVGDIAGPVETQFGVHIIKVNERTNRQVKFATIHLPIEVSPFTRNEIFDHATDFAYVANRGSFSEEAEFFGVSVRETGLFEQNGVIPGVGRNESVMRYAFEGRRGAISDVMEMPEGYGVFRITEVRREEVRPLDDVRAQIRSNLQRDKRRELALERVRDIRRQLEGRSLEDIEDIDSSIRLLSQNNVRLNSSISGVGRDQKFVGTALGMEEGQISPPVEGNRNIYLIELVRKTEIDEERYAEEREQIKERLLQSKRQEFFSQWIGRLREDATIVDNRYMFYR